MSKIYFTGAKGMYEPIGDQEMYSDSTPMVKTSGWSRIVERAHTITIIGGSLSDFVTAMFMVDAIAIASGKINTLVMPYVPGARQDRTNPTGDVLFTARSVTQMVNQRRFRKVVILDPHSLVTEILLNDVSVFPLAEVAKMIPNVYAGVIAADKGGQARAEEMASAMGLPVFYGGKTRDVSTGKLTGFTLDTLRPSYGRGFSKDALGHYLVVDDICDGGGTFNGLAEKITEQGATADLYVSHGIFSKGTGQLKEHYGTVFTTDSLPHNERNDVTILPVVRKMEHYYG